MTLNTKGFSVEAISDRLFSELKTLPFRMKEFCSVCGSRPLPFIYHADFPLTEIFVREPPPEPLGLLDLILQVCEECGHAQLANVIDSKVLYGQYSYRASMSAAGSSGNIFFAEFIKDVIEGKEFGTILDVGCNDSSLLEYLEPWGDLLVGVDPILEDGEKNGIVFVKGLLEDINFGELLSEKSLIVSSHVIEHVDEPCLFLHKMMDAASDDSIFVFQFPSFDVLVENSRFDQVFHHHLHYFSSHSFQRLLDNVGAELMAYTYNRPFWGSLLVAFKKASTQQRKTNFIGMERIYKSHSIFTGMMQNTSVLLKNLENERIFGFGAVLTLPALAYYLKNDFSHFSGILDDDEEKHGLYYLNLPVPVISSTGPKSLRNANILVTAVNHTRPIISKLLPLKPKRIITPFNSF